MAESEPEEGRKESHDPQTESHSIHTRRDKKVAQAAFPQGNLYTQMRDELGIYIGMICLSICIRVKDNPAGVRGV